MVTMAPGMDELTASPRRQPCGTIQHNPSHTHIKCRNAKCPGRRQEMQTAQLTLWARHDVYTTTEIPTDQQTASPRRQPCGSIQHNPSHTHIKCRNAKCPGNQQELQTAQLTLWARHDGDTSDGQQDCGLATVSAYFRQYLTLLLLEC